MVVVEAAQPVQGNPLELSHGGGERGTTCPGEPFGAQSWRWKRLNLSSRTLWNPHMLVEAASIVQSTGLGNYMELTHGGGGRGKHCSAHRAGEPFGAH